ncbi:NAD(P)-dependent oxidoreductase [Streptomyces sp. XD-27]|uniref:NAD-dependent epimerase/dehydratase family protein n=1 Tax=Streptomyces sp. XD-27 TaxID=3062779 RepID=UPI0026F438A7|nr:NAD(P)-dependent oxidoreductase [Streptomyces sp. XD-27]WKX71346.1 NAD(P)-dependent oxidoreductase [Streptomyces sp. XD-27]
MKPLRVLLTGATGFIGSAVARELLDHQAAGRHLSVRALARTLPQGAREQGAEGGSGIAWTTGDLSDRASLRQAVEGVDVLIHLASRISGSEAQCEAVNVHGTAALVEEAVGAGVERIVQLSTAAVYGAGPHRGVDVGEVVPAPVSPASRTRLAGEAPALAAGGHVLRPGLVLGAGDRWVVPALSELVARVPARWDGGRGRVSVVYVEDLARLIAALACAADAPPPGVYHASHPVPVRTGDLLDELAALGVLPPVTGDLPWDACLRRLREVPGAVSERQFSLLAQDHWYRSEEVWRLSGCPAGPGPLARLGEAAAWYRGHLAERSGAAPGAGSRPRDRG